jgi:hypothetical protein
MQDQLSTTLKQLANEGATPKAMMQKIKKLHPKASKKQIIRAAFLQMIDTAEHDLHASRALQNFALEERRSGTDDESSGEASDQAERQQIAPV